MLLLVKSCKRCGADYVKPPKISRKQWEEKYRHCEDCRTPWRQEQWKKGRNRWIGYESHRTRLQKLRKLRKTMKIAFVWQGISDKKVYEAWRDGLSYAIHKLKEKYTIDFFEPWQDIVGYDIILYWEAPVTYQGANGPHYNKVRQNPTKKALLFAGGPIKREWVEGFDLLFLESKENERECDELSIPWMHAFGINDREFHMGHLRSGRHPKKRKYDGILHGTCASWKRQWLIGEAFGPRGCVIGRHQESDSYPFNRCKELGSDVFPESGPAIIRELMADSYALVNPCDYWGGGQRATLEAMAAGLPVVCCTDSPKNREFVEESGFGRVVEPNAQAIKEAVEDLKKHPLDPHIGVNYVKEKFSGDVYAEQLLAGIMKLYHEGKNKD